MFIELLMENKGKNVDNYLFKLKLTASKTRLKMLRHVALICIIYCIIDMICTVACQEIEVVIDVSRFFPPLPLSQFCQTDCKKQFIKNLLSNSAYGISKTKDKFFTTTINIFFINNRTRCTYFNPLMPGQTYLNKPSAKI